VICEERFDFCSEASGAKVSGIGVTGCGAEHMFNNFKTANACIQRVGSLLLKEEACLPSDNRFQCSAPSKSYDGPTGGLRLQRSNPEILYPWEKEGSASLVVLSKH